MTATAATPPVRLNLPVSVPGLAPVEVRVTPSALAGAPRARMVTVAGTLGEARNMDIFADKLAQQGIETWAMAGTTTASRVTEHTDRIEAVVAQALGDGVPVAVAGDSAGANAVLGWRALHGRPNVPVAALNPVFMEKMLPWSDRFEVAKGMISRRLGGAMVSTPMSLGIPLTTNPESLEYAANLVHPEQMLVPASFFDDTAKLGMLGVARSGASRGALMVMAAGGDATAVNAATKVAAKLARADSFAIVPGAAHDLTQLADSGVAQWVGAFVKSHAW